MALTHKQEKFCQCIIDGMTQLDAYRTAYDAENMSNAAISVKASELMRDGNIKVRIAELKQQLDELNILPRATRLKVLAEIATRNIRQGQGKAKDADAINSIRVYNDMVGDNPSHKIIIDNTEKDAENFRQKIIKKILNE